MRLKIILFFIILILAAAAFISIRFYSYVFAKEVHGVVVGMERVTQTSAIIGGAQIPANQLYSFAVAIKDEKGEIITASSEDRQWAVVTKGQCAEAKFFPYPFWQLDKAGTYFGARLLRLYECNK